MDAVLVAIDAALLRVLARGLHFGQVPGPVNQWPDVGIAERCAPVAEQAEAWIGVADDPAGKVRHLGEEVALQEHLQTRVEVRPGRGGKGAIEIRYHDAEDFERVFELITGRTVGEVVE